MLVAVKVPPAVVRCLAGLILVALVVVDICYRASLAAFVTAHLLSGVIACAAAALLLAALITSLITGQFALGPAYQKWVAEHSGAVTHALWLAALLFVALLLRYWPMPLSHPSPAVLIFVLLVAGLAATWKAGRSQPSRDDTTRDIVITMRVLLTGLVFGLYLVLAAGGAGNNAAAESIERTAMGWGLAYFAVLFLIGFLFGIPRVLQADSAAEKKPDYQQRVNTNLEQISDWLTKIIVGLGLVQLRTVPEKLHQAATFMAQSFTIGTTPPTNAAISFAGAFIVFFSVLGFLAGYLSTRLFLAAAFFRADRTPEFVVENKQINHADATIDGILKFVKGDSANVAKLKKWLANKGKADLPMEKFSENPEYASLRQQALDDNAAGLM
jgi:MFS family permease